MNEQEIKKCAEEFSKIASSVACKGDMSDLLRMFRPWYDDIIKPESVDGTVVKSALIEISIPTQICLEDGLGNVIDALMSDLFDIDVAHLGQTDRHIIMVYSDLPENKKLKIDRMGIFLSILSWKVGDLQLKIDGSTYTIREGKYYWDTPDCNGDGIVFNELDIVLNKGQFPLELFNLYLIGHDGCVSHKDGKTHMTIDLSDSRDHSGIYKFLEYCISEVLRYDIDCYMVYGERRYLVY